MTAQSTNSERATAADGPVDRVRAALASEEGGLALYRVISAVVGSMMRGRPRCEIARRIEEVFNETAVRGLDRADQLRPGHDPVPWLKGIAKNVVHGDARTSAIRSRRVVPLDEDDPAWDRMTSALAATSSTEARMDVEAILSRLSPPARLAIECRFLRGLDGPELTKALGAPSDGAARQRVARASKALRDLFAPSGPEVAR